MIISDFTYDELEFFRKRCNFVNFEKQIFERRAEGVSLQQIAEDLDISYDYARYLSRKVNKKIIKVI